MKRKYRVVQLSTGKVGQHALPAILSHPELVLVGLWAHGSDKEGRDAASLAGLPNCGVQVTTDFEALCAIEADCAVYMSQVWGREQAAVDDVERLLLSGKNLVIPWMTYLHWKGYGRRLEPVALARIEKACAASGKSLLMTGCDPGFCTDMLPLALTGICDKVDRIRFQEILNYGGWHSELLFSQDFLGFGQAMDAPTPGFVRPELIEQVWGCTVAMLAAALGVEIDTLEHFEERFAAPRKIHHSHGVIEAGTVAARYFGMKACVPGQPEIWFEHITYVDEVPGQWQRMPEGEGGYRCIVDGLPGISLSFGLRGFNGDPVSGAEAVTATRCVNMIPAVCSAAPGVLDLFDFKLGELTRFNPGKFRYAQVAG